MYRRNFDGPLLHSPFQTYCVRMRYKNSNILYCVWVTLLFELLRFYRDARFHEVLGLYVSGLRYKCGNVRGR